MKRITNVMNLFLLLILFIIVPSVTFSQGNSNGNSNSNNNANVNALKWETQGNNADTSDFIGTTNTTALKMRTNNQERMRITPDGKIGVGISNPLERFELQGNLRLTGDVIFSNYADATDTTGKFLVVDEYGRTQAKTLDELQKAMYLSKLCPNDGSPILNPTWQNGENKIFSPCPQVNVGIGTSNPLRKLEVIGIAKATSLELGNPSASSALINGFRQTNQYGRLLSLGTNPPNGTEKIVMELFTNGELTLYHDGLGSPFTVFDENQFKLLQLERSGLLRARRIKIDLENWADFVFSDSYQLMPLIELRSYIQLNKHLPNVPSETELKKDGLDLAEMNKILMQKIEELTLYLLEQDKRSDVLKKQIEELRKELSNLK